MARRLGKATVAVARFVWHSGLTYLIIIAGLAAGSWLFYAATATPVLLVLDGQHLSFRTHQSTVAGLIQEIGLQLEPSDVVVPRPDSPLTSGDSVLVQRATLFSIEADGTVLPHYSHARRVGHLLLEAGIRFDSHDLVLWQRQPISFDTALPSPSVSSAPLAGSLGSLRGLPPRPKTQHITIRRAVPLYIHDGALEGEIYAVAQTVGEALHRQGIVLYVGDQVSPSLSSRLSAGLHVYIRRSLPAEILVDGRQIRTRTQASTVGELLAEEGVAPLGKDRVEPQETTPVVENMSIKIVRVREEFIVEEESIPFETIWEPDSSLEIDQQRLRQAGDEGLVKRRVRMTYEDGVQIAQSTEDEWTDRGPQTKILNYGTKIIPRTLETPDGTFEYWRRVRMLATSYTAATSGKTRDHPQYGITFLGWQMRAGIVAVDPTVVNLRSDVYVFGYGPGVAGDTGGAIKGRRIDLGYEEDDPIALTWYRWVDVYLLTPVPPASQVRWVLPNWPLERK